MDQLEFQFNDHCDDYTGLLVYQYSAAPAIDGIVRTMYIKPFVGPRFVCKGKITLQEGQTFLWKGKKYLAREVNTETLAGDVFSEVFSEEL